ncbi:MAG: tripartite tricarboxylate transporter substrate binding protein [Chloroflexota bacterium]
MKKSVWFMFILLVVFSLVGTACAVQVPAATDMDAGDSDSDAAMADDLGDYPERPVEFVVPWPPGDLEDVLTRLIAEEMQSQTGVPAAVVNKPGGGGVVGAIDVFQAEADGHTIGSFVIGIPTVHIMSGNAPYERGDFEPVGIFLTYPFVLATAGDAPYSDMAELAAYSNDNDVSLGHFGFGLVPTRASLLSMEDLGGKFASEAAFDALDCTTLSSGDVDVINTTIQLLLPCLDDVKILASIGADRLSVSPDTATLGEQGGIDIALWNGLFVRKGTPQAVKDMLAEVAQTALNSDAAKEVAETTGASIYWLGEADSQALIDADWDTITAMLERMEQ